MRKREYILSISVVFSLLLAGQFCFGRGGRGTMSSSRSSHPSVSRGSSRSYSVRHSPVSRSVSRPRVSSSSRSFRPSSSSRSSYSVRRSSHSVRRSSYSAPRASSFRSRSSASVYRPSTLRSYSARNSSIRRSPSSSSSYSSSARRTSSYRVPTSKGPGSSSLNSGRIRLSVPRSSNSYQRGTRSARTIRLSPSRSTGLSNVRSYSKSASSTTRRTLQLAPSANSSSDNIRRLLLSRYNKRFGSIKPSSSIRHNNSYSVRKSPLAGPNSLSRNNSYTVRKSPLLGERSLSKNSYSVRGHPTMGTRSLGKNSYSVRPSPLVGPAYSMNNSLGRSSSYSRNSYGNTAAYSRRGYGSGSINNRGAYVDSIGRTRGGLNGRSSGTTLYWGTTAFGSRSVVGTYLRVPLGSRGRMTPQVNCYHNGYNSRGYRYHHNYYGSCWGSPYYNGWGSPYYSSWGSPYYTGWGIPYGGFGFGVGFGFGLGYGGFYNYPGYSHVGVWYGPGLVRTHYISSGYPYWGLYGGTYVSHYYYNDYDNYDDYNNGFYDNDDDGMGIVRSPAETVIEQPSDEVVNVNLPAQGNTVNRTIPRQSDEEFLQGLNPAELSFVTGLTSFKAGDYTQASQAFYNSSLNSPDSVAPRLFLVVSLFSLGEYKHSADYLSDVYKKQPNLSQYRFNLLMLYGKDNQINLDRQMKTLNSYIELYPAQTDGYLVRGYISYCMGNYTGASKDFEMVVSLDNEIAVAGAFLKQLTAMSGKGAKSAPLVLDNFQVFLNSLRLRNVKSLKL